MNNILDTFAYEVRRKRKLYGYSQRQLAEKLNMNDRTIIELENCRSNPKFETIMLIAIELDISLDAIVFPDSNAKTVSKTVVDFFCKKNEAECQQYVMVCQQIDIFRKIK